MQVLTDVKANPNPNQRVVSLEELSQNYMALSPGLSKRAFMLLDSWRKTFQSERLFFEAFISADKRVISSLPGCNLFTRLEIVGFRKNLLDGAILEEEPALMTEHEVEEVREEEVAKIVEDKTSDSVIVVDAKQSDFVFSDVLFEDSEISPEPSSTFEGVDLSKLTHIPQLQESIGYFPLFATVKSFIDSLPEVLQTIAKECTRFYIDHQLADIGTVASELGLTSDALRNRRYTLLSKLEEFFQALSASGFIADNPYRYQMNHIETEINASEGTNFSLPFIYWALGKTYKDTTLIGDPNKMLTALSIKGQALFIAPTTLFDIFDFQGFIGTINEQLKVRRVNEGSISLSSLMAEHFKTRYYEEELPEVERTCRTFLYVNFPVEVDYGNVIFPSNKKKTNIQIVEEILQAAHHPMTLSEILDDFLYEYPERDVNEDRIRGAIYLSGKIIPTLPPGSYAWDDGSYEEFKGGSVITYVNTYLQSLPEKIATSADVAEYVTGIIPNTSEEKIVNRLFSEQAKDLITYYKDGVRYIGYIDGDYPDNFFCFPSDYRVALFYSTFFPQFIQFVETYHRFPFSSGVPSAEKRLRNSWIRIELDYERGNLDERTSRYFKKVLDNYGHYKVDKPEYCWRVQYSHIAREIGLELDDEEAFLLQFEPEKNNVSWLNHILEDYKYRIDRVPDWKIDKIEKIIRQLQSLDSIYSEMINKLKLNVQDNLG